MKSRLGIQRTLAVALAAVCVAGLLSSCDDLFGSDDVPVSYFGVTVDSLTYEPATPAVGDTLILRFWGLIGLDTCERFSHFETVRDSQWLLYVEAWGVQTHETVCGDAVQYLQDERLRVSPLYAGPFIVWVQQPNGLSLVDTVDIQP
ncbi:MAG TPA: hypothetical protein VE960_01340 [bacterium]|nr:hypothetical protein [bacterium]